MNKRKRAAFDDDVSVAKAQRFSLNVNAAAPSTKCRLDTGVPTTPRLDTFITKSTPATAPAAGRSPTRKRSSSGLLQTRKRFNPPAFAHSTHQSPALSISAALNGTKKSRLQSQARKTQIQTQIRTQSRARARAPTTKTIEESKPSSWFFDIFEESQETQEYRMNEWTMTQSATGLDISDDESKSKAAKSLDRGKENVDPNELPSAPMTRSMAAAAAVAAATDSLITDDSQDERKPLADLNPAKYYAEGLDATSVVLVHDDTPQQATEAEAEVESEKVDSVAKNGVSLSSTAKVIESLQVPSINEILGAIGSNKFDFKAATSKQMAETNAGAEIEIWESESAKDENEKPDPNSVPGSPASVGDQNVFALQEL
ncbi:hypothetical protein HRR80_007864 [Exophiala dermatitidis]|nr:hypothetical protein HRR77_008752 [Exophiala dermatitidis]KAJ4540132.1 hypothetical protein HRR76_003548 [Exophiala dermatitidis]KAJ4556836.1 hypothetical protein HRR79_008829 [Exophiala dermatitidis]KAJ4564367.1 hypothetical protein HRR82_009114 [Exophiala dermatitidis]KAJ4601264.1 hypothetical protein HRR85_009022 [Exophiala dermatitidis]